MPSDVKEYTYFLFDVCGSIDHLIWNYIPPDLDVQFQPGVAVGRIINVLRRNNSIGHIKIEVF